MKASQSKAAAKSTATVQRIFLSPVQDHGDRPHALLSGSQAERFMTCPGSVMLAQNITTPSKSSDAADEGTLAHTISELLFRKITRKTKIVLPDIPSHYDQSMMADCQKYVDEVLALPGELHIEVVLDFSKLHKNLGGTSDLINIERETRTLRVGDLKYGRSPVSAVNNYQLLTYAVGALETFNLYNDIDNVELYIFQPRGKNSSWSCAMSTVLEFKQQLVTAAHQTDDPFAPLHMTDKGCYWCKAKPICPEFAKVAKKSAAEDFKLPAPKTKAPSSFPKDKLLEVLDLAKLLSPWCDAVFQQAKDMLAEDEKALPGWGLKPGRSMTSWEDANKAMGLVTEALEDLPATLREQVLDACITKPKIQDPAKVQAAFDELDLVCEESEEREALGELRAALSAVTESKKAASSLVRLKQSAET